jgi:hypothetical protein
MIRLTTLISRDETNPKFCHTSAMDQYDLSDLLAKLKTILYGDMEAREYLQENGVNVTRSDFYSEIPTINEIRNARKGPNLKRLFEDNNGMRSLLNQLIAYSSEFDPPREASNKSSYHWTNSQFSHSDAMTYYCMIRLFKPKTIIEIGSGWSALVAYEALKKNESGVLKVIEPYPREFLKEIPDIDLVVEKFQDIDTEELALSVQSGDFVFIDSTHALKYGSEVLNIYLDFLHLIPNDCFIHVHDIYLPEAFPVNLMLEHQVFWGEQYLLYAYLLNNKRTQILYGSHYHKLVNPDLLTTLMQNKDTISGASIWIKQQGNYGGSKL